MKRVKLPEVDPWNAVTLAGAASLGGGIWAQWGGPWAFMLWGCLLLALPAIRGWRVGAPTR